MQSTSHEHASLHLTRRLHAFAPVHVTSHGCLPHWISSAQESMPVHWTSHEEASPQITLWSHERSPHTTRHGMLGGHATSIGHVSVALQSITQTPATQVPFGQPSSHSGRASTGGASVVAIAASGATMPQTMSGAVHQPSVLQTCPPRQSFGLPHATVQSRPDGE